MAHNFGPGEKEWVAKEIEIQLGKELGRVKESLKEWAKEWIREEIRLQLRDMPKA